MEEIKDFTAYLEHLCRRHVDIRHEYDGKHFVNMNDKVISGNDSQLCYPCVLLEKDAYKYDGQEGAFVKDRDYMIFVMDHVRDIRDYDEINSVQEKCEAILDELFNQILEDKRLRKYRFLSGFSLPGTQAEPIENTKQALYGVVAVFSLANPYRPVNCRKAFLQDRVFNESFDQTFK